MSSIHGESWDLASEFPAADSPPIAADLSTVDGLLDEIEQCNATLTAGLGELAQASVESATDIVAIAQRAFGLVEQAERLLGDAATYAECCLSVDSQDEAAQELLGRLQSKQKRFATAAEPLAQFQDLAPDEVVEQYLSDETVAAARFNVEHSRKRRHELLPIEQETLSTNLAHDGIHAWGRLYDQLAGTLSCTVEKDGETRTFGLAEASGLLLSADEPLRERAWRAINNAWDEHAESCAAAINAIAGWRLEMCRQRSGAEHSVHFLDAPVHMNRIERQTLDTVLGIAKEGVPLARRAARLQAKAYGKEHYGPWDQRAPAPAQGQESASIPYAEAVELIAESYGAVDQQMGDFVHMMAKNRWIEGTVGQHKRPGAYCTGFRKSRTPRVYMTYTGGTSDVITLAHELGHAFHSWAMRDLPESQRRYGMAIAETASTFGESVVRDALLARADTPAARMEILWEEAAALVAFILNIPTRFEFERDFYTAREQRPQRPAELKAMMSAAWKKWYGDCLAEPDPLFWASKLHFYISGLSFYNFPYLFGYLFSLGVYARRQTFGDAFFENYVALLRDTGRMTAEELAAKHLQVDLTKPDFWRDTLEMLGQRMTMFENLVEREAD